MQEEVTKQLPPLSPGATIGMLGGGQLGRMSLLAGRRMGYRFVVLDPAGEAAPAAPVADAVIAAEFDDEEGLDRLAALCERVTLEFENIPTEAVVRLNEKVAVCPGRRVLEVCQHRQREKEFLRDAGFPCAPFAVVRSREDLATAVNSLGMPCVLKTAAFGYDGKGQIKLEEGTDLGAAWVALGHHTGVVEKWIRFEGEFSVICARNAAGEEAVYAPFENLHRDHILDTTIWPARLGPDRAAEAFALGSAVARALGVIGLLTVELFLTGDGWIVNELAPRPHNSGHVTFDAAVTSQFEQHIRAVANLPLGDPSPLCSGVMVNLLGDRWPAGGIPNWRAVWNEPRAKLHLYGKREARPGRKMGHFTVIDDSVDRAEAMARGVDEALPRYGVARGQGKVG
jgi:5-(carboxyamino)imidazole ribonucleotide synthase